MMRESMTKLGSFGTISRSGWPLAITPDSAVTCRFITVPAVEQCLQPAGSTFPV
ncbi:hypothetical protein [Mesorhizobium sp.]|uniref:hypothetical protein n=1 Tax=Mesorhizobium sp. TaxID=1871066 RepID=UPI0025E16EE1|nr:hypothetical protein [Mesorhizobium sp.]